MFKLPKLPGLSFQIIIIFLMFACKPQPKDKNSLQSDKNDHIANESFQEVYRPQFHFSPQEMWMNDPNGMVFHRGIYHLFYQYYPEDKVWGPMHWGHATSKDLLHWEHKGVKLFPDEHGYIFSGSAVVDQNNSSGLGSKEVPPLVAIFTYHDPKGQKNGKTNFQTQGIAFSNDNGVSWKMYKENPVLENPGIKDFRDPKVRWHEPSKNWIMTLAAGDHLSFFSSKDLIHWNELSEFGKDIGAHGGVWECPDLFPMTIQGTDKVKWILLVSINPGGPNGGSATQYFVGSFDGISFTPEDTKIRWIDYGTDNYAGVTYSNSPDNKKLFLGWMSNWNYAQETPTNPWRSAMTIPRELILAYHNNDYFLQNIPIKSFENLRIPVSSETDLNLDSPYQVSEELTDQTEIIMTTNLDKLFSLELSNELEEAVILTIDPKKKEIRFDRRRSGKTNFSEKFANKIHILPYLVDDDLTELRVLIDKSSIEVFIEGGRYVMTEQVFPNRPYHKLRIVTAEMINIKELNINRIKSIWNE